MSEISQVERDRLADGLEAYAEGVEENLADDGVEDAPDAEDFRSDADRIRAGDQPLHEHTLEVLRDETGPAAYEDSPSGYLDLVERLIANENTVMREGTRVRLTCDVERYPHFTARKGMVGTVTMMEMDEAVCVRLDEFLPGAEDWDNEVCWYPQNGDDPSAYLETIKQTDGEGL